MEKIIEKKFNNHCKKDFNRYECTCHKMIKFFGKFKLTIEKDQIRSKKILFLEYWINLNLCYK